MQYFGLYHIVTVVIIRSDGLLISTDFIRFSLTMAYRLWYRPKYCIIGVENKSSRFSLKLELFQRFNTHLRTLLSTQDIKHDYYCTYRPTLSCTCTV